jgi:hypothetical protein
MAPSVIVASRPPPPPLAEARALSRPAFALRWRW